MITNTGIAIARSNHRVIPIPTKRISKSKIILIYPFSSYIEIVPQCQVRVKSFQNFFSINLCNDNKGLAAANQQKRLDKVVSSVVGGVIRGMIRR